MFHPLHRFAAAAACTLLCAWPAVAATKAEAPDLDLSIRYTTRVLTAEGVTRESRYEESMMRRPGHVWLARVLPKNAGHDDDHAGMKKAVAKESHVHKHFNHVVLPRHVANEGGKLKLEFVDVHEREVVVITPAEYENVNFDGSWANAFYLVDPKAVAELPLSNRRSDVPGARWREREKNGVFQRVLWDEARMVPLVMETGDRNETFFQRIEVKVLPNLSVSLPWQNLKGFAQKEYTDFLD